MKSSHSEIREAFEFQRTQNIGWTFYDEREHMENLLQSRFNFLITVYALFVSAIFTSDDQSSKLLCLIIGFIITSLIGITVYRAYLKFNVLLDILYNVLGDKHAAAIVNQNVKHIFFSFHVNWIIGIIIPLLLPISFVIGIVLLKLCGFNLK